MIILSLLIWFLVIIHLFNILLYYIYILYILFIIYYLLYYIYIFCIYIIIIIYYILYIIIPNTAVFGPTNFIGTTETPPPPPPPPLRKMDFYCSVRSSVCVLVYMFNILF